MAPKKTKSGPLKAVKPQGESSDADVDINSIIQVPYGCMMTGVIDSLNLHQIYETIRKVENIVEQHPKLVAQNFHKLLSLCMNFLELEPKLVEGAPSSPSDPNGALNPIRFQLQLGSFEVICLKRKVLALLTSLMKVTKKSRLFSFWFAFLPGCERLNPYKFGIFHLVRLKSLK